LAAVTPSSVRERLNLTVNDISDAVVTNFIVDAVAEIELETGLTIDYNNCSAAEAAAVRALAAIYCLCYVTGGSSAGMNFSVGDMRVDVLANCPPLEILIKQVERLIAGLSKAAFKVAEA